MDLGRELMGRFGSLRGVLGAPRREIMAAPGLGPARSAQLEAAVELGRRVLSERLYRDGPLTAPDRARDYLLARLGQRRREAFCCIYLDTRHQVLSVEEPFQGTVDGASVHPRVIVQRALELNATALIVAHNHPSGVAEPSRADEQLTRRLRDALALMDIRLLDHLVIGDGVSTSFSERGLL